MRTSDSKNDAPRSSRAPRAVRRTFLMSTARVSERTRSGSRPSLDNRRETSASSTALFISSRSIMLLTFLP